MTWRKITDAFRALCTYGGMSILLTGCIEAPWRRCIPLSLPAERGETSDISYKFTVYPWEKKIRPTLDVSFRGYFEGRPKYTFPPYSVFLDGEKLPMRFFYEECQGQFHWQIDRPLFLFGAEEHELTIRLTKEQLEFFNQLKKMPNVRVTFELLINADVTIPDIFYLYCYMHEEKSPDKITPVETADEER